MQLVQGAPLPDIGLEDLDGRAVHVADYRDKLLWLILSRFVACPFCSLRLDTIARRYALVRDAGVETLVVFPSSVEGVKNYVARYQPPFRVVADPHRVLFDKLGAETSWAGELRSAVNLPKVVRALAHAKLNPLVIDDAVHRMPSDYLVGPDGIIDRVHYGRELDDGFTVEDVVQWADARGSTNNAGP